MNEKRPRRFEIMLGDLHLVFHDITILSDDKEALIVDGGISLEEIHKVNESMKENNIERQVINIHPYQEFPTDVNNE